MNRDVLIGHTGFVGSTLARSRDFSACFNSQNIEEIRGRTFDTVFCAGVSAVKWMANKEPDRDRRGLDKLVDCLEAVSARRFVLISTIDVYPSPVGVTENDIPDISVAQPYGRHRRELEIWASDRFDRCIIVRLPGLFGKGLKKNLIFDWLYKPRENPVSLNGQLQWYPTQRLSADLQIILDAGVDLINIAPQPICTRKIHDRFFPDIKPQTTEEKGPRYDVHTSYASILGGAGNYHLGEMEIFRELENFIKEERL